MPTNCKLQVRHNANVIIRTILSLHSVQSLLSILNCCFVMITWRQTLRVFHNILFQNYNLKILTRFLQYFCFHLECNQFWDDSPFEIKAHRVVGQAKSSNFIMPSAKCWIYIHNVLYRVSHFHVIAWYFDSYNIMLQSCGLHVTVNFLWRVEFYHRHLGYSQLLNNVPNIF